MKEFQFFNILNNIRQRLISFTNQGYPGRINNHMSNKMCLLHSNFLLLLITNYIAHFKVDVITYQWRKLSSSMSVKWTLGVYLGLHDPLVQQRLEWSQQPRCYLYSLQYSDSAPRRWPGNCPSQYTNGCTSSGCRKILLGFAAVDIKPSHLSAWQVWSAHKRA